MIALGDGGLAGEDLAGEDLGGEDLASEELAGAESASGGPAEGEAAGTGGIPLLAGRGLVKGSPAAYVCRDFTCLVPVTEPAALREALGYPV